MYSFRSATFLVAVFSSLTNASPVLESRQNGVLDNEISMNWDFPSTITTYLNCNNDASFTDFCVFHGVSPCKGRGFTWGPNVPIECGTAISNNCFCSPAPPTKGPIYKPKSSSPPTSRSPIVSTTSHISSSTVAPIPAGPSNTTTPNAVGPSGEDCHRWNARLAANPAFAAQYGTKPLKPCAGPPPAVPMPASSPNATVPNAVGPDGEDCHRWNARLAANPAFAAQYGTKPLKPCNGPPPVTPVLTGPPNSTILNAVGPGGEDCHVWNAKLATNPAFAAQYGSKGPLKPCK